MAQGRPGALAARLDESHEEQGQPAEHDVGADAVFAAVIGGAYDCRIITYPLAALVGLGRIYKEKHWASDVFFGALLGSIVGEAHAAGMKKQADSKVSFYVEPVNAGAIYGIKIRF